MIVEIDTAAHVHSIIHHFVGPNSLVFIMRLAVYGPDAVVWRFCAVDRAPQPNIHALQLKSHGNRIKAVELLHMDFKP